MRMFMHEYFHVPKILDDGHNLQFSSSLIVETIGYLRQLSSFIVDIYAYRNPNGGYACEDRILMIPKNFGSLFAFHSIIRKSKCYARDKNIFKFFSKNIYKINLKCIFVLEYDHIPII